MVRGVGLTDSSFLKRKLKEIVLVFVREDSARSFGVELECD